MTFQNFRLRGKSIVVIFVLSFVILSYQHCGKISTEIGSVDTASEIPAANSSTEPALPVAEVDASGNGQTEGSSHTNIQESDVVSVGCSAGTKTWDAGGISCATNYPAVNTGMGTFSDTFGKYQGSIGYICNNGQISFPSGSATCGTFVNNQLILAQLGPNPQAANAVLEDCYSSSVKLGANFRYGTLSTWGNGFCNLPTICETGYQLTQLPDLEPFTIPPPGPPKTQSCEILQRGSCKIEASSLVLTKAHHTWDSDELYCTVNLLEETLNPGQKSTYSCSTKFKQYQTSKTETTVTFSVDLECRSKIVTPSLADNAGATFSYKNIVVVPGSSSIVPFFYAGGSNGAYVDKRMPAAGGGIKFTYDYSNLKLEWCGGESCYNSYHRFPLNGY